jgi:hypothetical protein
MEDEKIVQSGANGSRGGTVRKEEIEDRMRKWKQQLA